MRNFSNFILLMLALSVPIVNSQAQTAPVIGSPASTFTLFTSAGALTNTGESVVTGDIGTNAGNYSGFNGSVLIGTSHVADGISAAAVPQVAEAFTSFDVNACPAPISPTLGNGQTLTAGIYCVGEAATLTGNLTLDAQSNPNAVFIIKIGGALTTAALSNVLLTNGAQLSNVYFRIDGALTTGTNSSFRGTVVSSGAIEFLDGASFQGRALTTAGAITLNNNQVNGEVPLPVVLTKFNAERSENESVLISWSTASETNSERFEVQHSVNGKEWKELGFVAAKGESAAILSYTFAHAKASRGSNYYRLKMVDKDQTFAYSRIKSIEFRPNVSVVMYPNPTPNSVTLMVEDIEQVQRIQLINISGIAVFDQQKAGLTSLGSQIDMKQYPAGAYVARVTAVNGSISSVRIVKL
ncbi:ice-binding family protein [Dyadobacter sp. CY345]|uniref:ice-binding family protein n=1 Tax=Dyadobacter sp. CY345 TaxID=2909335 RepID=UPI001F271093|nr:ice-binding family protein [Dyadobacter sp. CY345]MCF2447668.1 ice-binding family protein [Dyadobacter sp. CY345]